MRDILIDLEEGQDPQRQAQKHMQPKKPKRFYKEVSIGQDAEGHAILLDGKAVKTPGKGALRLPTAKAAQLIADEFSAQTEEIDVISMPVTRISNSAFAGVTDAMQEVRDDIVRFAGSDVVCYRANTPTGLMERQKAAWDPLIDWSETYFEWRPQLVGGIIYVEQPHGFLDQVRFCANQITDPYKLAALHVMTTLTGSAIIAFAHAMSDLDIEAAWNAAHIDEDWNIEKWGYDSESDARRKLRYTEMLGASQLFKAI